MEQPSDVETAQNQKPAGPSEPGLANFTYVGILLIVVIGLLAVLWTRDRRLLSAERGLRITAEQKAVRLQQENDSLRRAMALIGKIQTSATQPSEQD